MLRIAERRVILASRDIARALTVWGTIPVPLSLARLCGNEAEECYEQISHAREEAKEHFTHVTIQEAPKLGLHTAHTYRS